MIKKKKITPQLAKLSMQMSLGKNNNKHKSRNNFFNIKGVNCIQHLLCKILNLFKNPNSEKEKLKDRCSHVIIFVRDQALAQHLTLTQTKLKQLAESRRKKKKLTHTYVHKEILTTLALR